MQELNDDEEPQKCPKCKIVHIVTSVDKKLYETVLGVEEFRDRLRKRTDTKTSKLSRGTAEVSLT